MNFQNFRLLYLFSCFALCLIILLPTFSFFISFPKGQEFSELWILGPTHMMEGYPLNVSSGGVYNVFLGIENHMGSLQYYLVRIKLRNQSEPFPDSIHGIPSDLPAVFDYQAFLSDGDTWEKEVTFSFEDVSLDGNVGKVSGFYIDGFFVDVDKVAVWNDDNSGFFYQLFFELWVYDSGVSGFKFHNRSVGLWLNMSRQL